MRLVRLCAAAAVLSVSAGFALAQTVPAQPNPLRPGNASTATPPQATPAPSAEAPKPKRQRSEAQLANDNRMRACGAEWRANKAALTAQGKTWRVFNVECRARLKAQGR